MKIETTRFGIINMPADRIVQMPFGMLGFPDKKRFVLIGHKEKTPFRWFQSVEEPSLAFVVVSPYAFKPDYAVDVDEAVTAMFWENAEKNDLELYVVVTIPQGEPEKMTANLIGPILVHAGARQAVQLVLSNSDYSHKHLLFSARS